MTEYAPFTRTGQRFPVRAVLCRTGKSLCLTLQAEVWFSDLRAVRDGISVRNLKNRILSGFRSWKGTYPLESGEMLNVQVFLRETKRRGGSLPVLLLDRGTLRGAEVFAGKGKLGRKIRRGLRTPGFAFTGLRPQSWRPWKNGPVGIRTDMEKFPVEEIARHEFGHVLGLGDLYRDPLLGLMGIAGKAAERFLPFRREDGRYHAVMDDNGPVTPLDAEMMLLAQCGGRMQLYQKKSGRGDVSVLLQ